MKQLIQSFKTGELGLFQGNFSLCETTFASFDLPALVYGRNGAFIQTTVSLVSADTKRLYEK